MSPILKPNPNPNPAPPESQSQPTPPPVELEVFKAMLEAKIASLADRITSLEHNRGFFPLPRLKFPTFDGKSELSQWIFKAEQYFNLLQVPEKQKVPLARYFLEGDALQWLMWMEDRTKARLDWAKFVRGIKDRFGTVPADNFFRLTELKQTGDLEVYEAEFLRLKDKVFGADESNIVSFYIGGLREELKMHVFDAEPETLVKAVEIARMYETKLKIRAKHGRLEVQ